MKTKRFVSTLLALLLICGLPVSAFADKVANNPAGTTVTEIPAGDTMYYNSGTVTNNDGTVTFNYGTVTTNSSTGTVNSNQPTGIVTTNDGIVVNNKGTLTNNEGILHNNEGIVTNNNATVASNSSKGTVTNNNKGATVNNNFGTVGNNYGTVGTNGTAENNDNAKVGTNNNFVYENYGTVDTNNGTVVENYGTVETNAITGKITNYGGEVGKNYGTVTEVKDNEETTTYGVQVVGENNNDPIRKDQGVDLDLAERFTKEGHVLTGYIQNYGMQNDKVTSLENPIPVNSTVYTADCPNVLTLIWQAIVNPGSGEVAAAAAADNGAADFGPGIYISINGHQYMLVAVVEDVYCLASVESYEAEELADLPALLSSLLTEEQLTHVTGEAELLDEELTAYFFAGRGSHIVFSCDKGLIFS